MRSKMMIGWLLFVLSCSSGLALAQEKAQPKGEVTVNPVTVKPAATAPAASQPATVVATPQVPGEPQTAAQAVESAKQGIEYAKAKNWWGLSSIVIFLIMFGLNATKLFDKIGKRWAYIILPVLGVAAMLLAKFAGDLSWGAAIAVLTSAPCMGLAWDFVKRGILAQEVTTTMKPTPPV
jgi:hypothetical protein